MPGNFLISTFYKNFKIYTLLLGSIYWPLGLLTYEHILQSSLLAPIPQLTVKPVA